METAVKKRSNKKFSLAEDNILRELVLIYGDSSWEEIALEMEGRNPRQCHDRWYYYLSPKINNAPWTEEEDKTLVKTYYALNGKWVQIAKKFKGRTDTQIKNRFNTLRKTMNIPSVQKEYKTSQVKQENTNSDKNEADCFQTDHETTGNDPYLLISAIMEEYAPLFDRNVENMFL